MSTDTTSVRVPFRVHQKVRDWALANNFSVGDAWAHLAELGLEHLELIAESERIPEFPQSDLKCPKCGSWTVWSHNGGPGTYGTIGCGPAWGSRALAAGESPPTCMWQGRLVRLPDETVTIVADGNGR